VDLDWDCVDLTESVIIAFTFVSQEVFSFSGDDNTCDWRAYASIDADGDTVSGSFQPAPVRFGFRIYNVSLLSRSFVLLRLTVSATDEVNVFITMHLVLLLI